MKAGSWGSGVKWSWTSQLGDRAPSAMAPSYCAKSFTNIIVPNPSYPEGGAKVPRRWGTVVATKSVAHHATAKREEFIVVIGSPPRGRNGQGSSLTRRRCESIRDRAAHRHGGRESELRARVVGAEPSFLGSDDDVRDAIRR